MTPYLSIVQRVIAWLLWRFEGFDSDETAAFEILEHPELLRCASLLRDYWYAKRAEEWAREWSE